MRKLLPWLLNAVLVIAVIGVSAQNKEASRVPLIGNDTTDPDAQKIFQSTVSRGGYILNLNRMIANAPKLMAPAGAYARALRYYADDIPRNYRELMIVRTLQVEGGDYEFALHTQKAVQHARTGPSGIFANRKHRAKARVARDGSTDFQRFLAEGDPADRQVPVEPMRGSSIGISTPPLSNCARYSQGSE